MPIIGSPSDFCKDEDMDAFRFELLTDETKVIYVLLAILAALILLLWVRMNLEARFILFRIEANTRVLKKVETNTRTLKEIALRLEQREQTKDKRTEQQS
jgi:hypothetical protein